MVTTSSVNSPRRKRSRRETNATTTTPPPTVRSSPGNGQRGKDDSARVVWRDSPAEKQIRVSGTGKLAQQEEVQGFVGRLARASGMQSPPGLTPTNGRDQHVRTDSDDEADRKRKKSKIERGEPQSKRSSLTRLVPVTGIAITPPHAGLGQSSVSRHILFSPDSETTNTRSHEQSHAVAVSSRVSTTTSQRSTAPASSRGGESQDELMLLDQLDERLSRETPEVADQPVRSKRQSLTDTQPATASTAPAPTSTSAFVTPPRHNSTRIESSVTQVTPPVTVQQKLEFESPDFTAESWELLNQLEFEASQQQKCSQQVPPPAPSPHHLHNSVVVPPTKHNVSPCTEAHPVVVSSFHSTSTKTPSIALQGSPSVDKRLVFDEGHAAGQHQATIDRHEISDAPDANFKRLLVLEIDRDHYHRRVVMRLLDEEENHVEIELIEDWFETDVDAGDTIHLILSEQDRSGFFSQGGATETVARQGHGHPNGFQRVVVDNDHNLVIVHPDILVSPTSVTTSFGCLRRAVLRETLNVSRPTNPKALLGTLKHELFQRALESSKHDIEFMLSEAQHIVSTNVLKLMESSMSEETALRELGGVMQDYQKWLIDSNRGGVQIIQPPGGPTTKVLLRQIMAVEEMLWSIKWGLKGATDATVQATFSPLDGGVVIPLELKTGSKYANMEHQGQVMLYTLMLSERYQQRCQDGLLMYVPGIETNRISAMATHIRGLIIARNKFATAMSRVKAMGSSSSSHHQQALPPMLRRKRDCDRCFQVQECVLHHAAVENGSAESSGLEEGFQRQVGHLGDTDLAYFRKWNRLIDLEHQNADKNLRALWLQPGSRRERDPESLCISKLRVVNDSPAPRGSSGSASMRILVLRRDTRAPPDLASSFLEIRFRVDDRVIISVESIDEKKLLVHVARGRIAGIMSDSIVLETFQSIPSVVASGKSIVGSQYTWRVDKDAIISSLSRAKENLVKLLVGPAPEEVAEGTATHLRADLLSNAISQVVPSQAAEQVGDVRRRKLVVHLLKPRFRSSKFLELLQQRELQRTSPHDPLTDRAHQLHDEFVRLNIDQQRGVMKVLNSLDYALILGMPGTGKTSTIAFTVKVLVHLGLSVLISSYTHSAVDNLLLKLLSSDIPMIRVGNSKQVHPALLPYTLEHSIGGESGGGMTVGAVEARIKAAKVIGCTCLGVNSHVLFSKRRFDFCIVDEATQTTEPVVLGPLRCADTFVLVGDHYQLPPLVANAQAKKEGMDVSLFRRLSEAHPEATQQLSYQYRMNSDIMMLANRLVYADKLKCGSHEVSANQLVLELPVELQLSAKVQAAWPVQVLQSHQGVRFINTDGVPGVGEKAGGTTQIRSRKLENVVEARVLAGLVQVLVTGGVPPAEIAVISPFRAQVAVIVQQLREVMGPDANQVVEVSTIDEYQGKDKDVVLVSFVRCNPENNVGELLTDWRRINVALTRAKQKLILVGSKQTLCAGSSLFHTLLELISSRQWEVALPATAMHTLDEVVSIVRPHCAARMETLRVQVEPEPETEPVVVMHQQASHDIEALVPSGVPIRRNGVGPSRQTRGPITKDIMGEFYIG